MPCVFLYFPVVAWKKEEGAQKKKEHTGEEMERVEQKRGTQNGMKVLESEEEEEGRRRKRRRHQQEVAGYLLGDVLIQKLN
ncbi:hypothetical protein B9Z55_001511 [Caenorhabditis nigoni]|uniref:Uncharacterized protein n=1 Tax=Caenorhabditis nigoni TaxID=1611254 RepID=A0A2G5VG24_9PELO|nr:hypothetical protein B9Z55_001511 [Caenorhabditis nigoni]